MEKGLLHLEIKTLNQKLETLNENYDQQIEVSFNLQDQLTIAEEALVALTETNKTQQAKYDQLTEDLSRQNSRLEAIEAELESTQQQFTALQLQHQGQADLLAATEEELRQHKGSQLTSPDTLRSEDRTPHASDSTTPANTSVEEALNQPGTQEGALRELQQELTHVQRERDELQMTLERIMESPRNVDEETLGPADLPRTSTLPKASIYHKLTTNISPFTTVMQYYHALKGINLLVSGVPILRPGVTLSKAQFEQIWGMADATARDTIAFMWVTCDLKLATGVMELVTGSPPFYVGRFVLRTLTFISHHYSVYYNHVPMNRLPTMKPYPKSTYHQIKEFVKNQPITFGQALTTLTTEDTTICYEAVQQYKWLQERHPHKIPGPYTIQQIKAYVTRVIQEKELTISTRRFGSPSPRTILQTDQYHI